ncbi:MAG TPA: anthranilate phosphoribosyltransferase [Dehalococcoidia bacterium]|nr:anthranilate phosphoribosyltransferase [Dehalococcoidia bacterium]
MIRDAIAEIVGGRSLTRAEAAAAMDEMMSGEATGAQFGAFLTALRMKGETVEELTGFAEVMRAKVTPVEVGLPIVDTCGTGGDASGTFNVSTAAAFVVAAAGVPVAKHGNRAMSSHCGSADVLEALGVKIDLPAEGVATCVREVGLGFMFAPLFHPAMRHAVAPRREIGIRTVFNVLGPLTNPAGARSQVLGVPDPALPEKMAQVLGALGCRHALVVHGRDGVDEITIAGPTLVAEVTGGRVRTYEIRPGDVGLPESPLSAIQGGDAATNAGIIRGIFAGNRGPARDIVLLNAAAALVVGGAAAGLAEGVKLAGEVIDRGRALAKVDELAAVSQRLAGV